MNLADHIRTSDACDLCGADIATHGKTVASGDLDHPKIRVHLNTIKCSECGFVFQRECFSEALLSDLYKTDTSFDFGSKSDERAKVHDGLVKRQAVISRALGGMGIGMGARILDVGGGRGECCKHLVPMHHVVIADATVELPVDPRIEKISGLFTSSIRDASFDVVIMNHVLEHVFSPTELLASGYSVLKDRGILIVEVPFELYTPLVFRHLGDWRHVAYFSRQTFRQFIEKSGFVVTRLVLEMGDYGTRRLPVIRAVAYKDAKYIAKPIKKSVAPLLSDMVAPVVLWSFVARVLGRQ